MSRMKYRRVRGGRVNATARDIEAILRKWGFVLARTTGGHHQYQHPDHAGTVTLRAPGRPSEEITFGTVEQAAAIVGVPPLEFLNSTPPTRRPKPVAPREEHTMSAPEPAPEPAPEVTTTERLDAEVAAIEAETPAAVHPWRTDPDAPTTDRILAWAAAHGEPFTVHDVAIGVGLPRNLVTVRLKALEAKPERTGIVCLHHAGKGTGGRNVYGYDASIITDPLRTRASKHSRAETATAGQVESATPFDPVESGPAPRPKVVLYPLPERIGDDRTPTVPERIGAAKRFDTMTVTVVGANTEGETIASLPDGRLVRLVNL